jgi:TPR repeat protein
MIGGIGRDTSRRFWRLVGSKTQLVGTVKILVVAVALCVTALPAASETPYNLGVAAWQKKNYVEAARQWSAAVLTGNLDAMNNLAYLYSNGLGVAHQDAVALSLWQSAAYSGHSESQWHLGTVYEQGLGVSADLVRAYAWYGCALASAKRNTEGETADVETKIGADAESSLAALKEKLDDKQLARAEVLRAQLVERYGKAAP